MFHSDTAAQVRLVPRALASPQGRVRGDGGELLATTGSDRSGQPVFSLWFCTRAGSEASAAWQLVAGPRSSPLPGAPAVTDPGSVLAHLAALANARHVFVNRLIQDGRVEDAAAASPPAIEAYRQLADTPGADLVRVAGGLHELSGQLTEAGLTAESAAAEHASKRLIAGRERADERVARWIDRTRRYGARQALSEFGTSWLDPLVAAPPWVSPRRGGYAPALLGSAARS